MGPSSLMALLSLFGLSVVFLLAVPSRRIAALLGGWRRQLRLHHGLALASLITLSAHVASETLDLGPELVFSSDGLSEPSLALGLLSTLLFFSLLAGVKKSPLSNRASRLLHLMSYPALLAALAHAWLFLDGPVLENRLAGSVLGVGVVLFLVTTIAHFWVPSQRRLQVIRVETWLPGVFELQLTAPAAHALAPYPAGSLVALRLSGRPLLGRWHLFSVASCRYERTLRLLIRAVGHDTHTLGQLKPTETVFVRGPFKDHISQNHEDEVWISGGVGIAPFIGKLHCGSFIKGGRRELLHFAKSQGEAHMLESRLLNITRTAEPSTPACPSRLVVRDLQREPELKEIDALIKEHPNAHYFVCGPPGFMQLVRTTLAEHMIPKKQITTEELSL